LGCQRGELVAQYIRIIGVAESTHAHLDVVGAENSSRGEQVLTHAVRRRALLPRRPPVVDQLRLYVINPVLYEELGEIRQPDAVTCGDEVGVVDPEAPESSGADSSDTSYDVNRTALAVSRRHDISGRCPATRDQ